MTIFYKATKSESTDAQNKFKVNIKKIELDENESKLITDSYAYAKELIKEWELYRFPVIPSVQNSVTPAICRLSAAQFKNKNGKKSQQINEIDSHFYNWNFVNEETLNLFYSYLISNVTAIDIDHLISVNKFIISFYEKLNIFPLPNFQFICDERFGFFAIDIDNKEDGEIKKGMDFFNDKNLLSWFKFVSVGSELKKHFIYQKTPSGGRHIIMRGHDIMKKFKSRTNTFVNPENGFTYSIDLKIKNGLVSFSPLSFKPGKSNYSYKIVTLKNEFETIDELFSGDLDNNNRIKRNYIDEKELNDFFAVPNYNFCTWLDKYIPRKFQDSYGKKIFNDICPEGYKLINEPGDIELVLEKNEIYKIYHDKDKKIIYEPKNSAGKKYKDINEIDKVNYMLRHELQQNNINLIRHKTAIENKVSSLDKFSEKIKLDQFKKIINSLNPIRAIQNNSRFIILCCIKKYEINAGVKLFEEYYNFIKMKPSEHKEKERKPKYSIRYDSFDETKYPDSFLYTLLKYYREDSGEDLRNLFAIKLIKHYREFDNWHLKPVDTDLILNARRMFWYDSNSVEYLLINPETEKYIYRSRKTMMDAFSHPKVLVEKENDKGIKKMVETPLYSVIFGQRIHHNYDYISFKPYGRNPPEISPDTKFLNTFTGFEFEYDPNYIYDPNSLKTIKYFIEEVYCQGNSEQYNYFYKWMASMFQYPEKKVGVAVFLHSHKHGIGKSCLWDKILTPLLTNGHVFKADGTLDKMLGRFNSHLEFCLLSIFEEIKSSQNSVTDQLKAIITSETMQLEKKGHDIRQVHSYMRIGGATNNRYTFELEQSNRRYLFLECDHEKVTKEILDQYHRDAENKIIRKNFFHFLYNIDCMDFYKLCHEIPGSALNDEMKKTSQPDYIDFLFTLLNDDDKSLLFIEYKNRIPNYQGEETILYHEEKNFGDHSKTGDDKYYIQPKNLYICYVIYCESYRSKPMSAKQFNSPVNAIIPSLPKKLKKKGDKNTTTYKELSYNSLKAALKRYE